MGKSFEDVKVMEAFIVPTKWDVTNLDDNLKKFPTKEAMLDMFLTYKSTKAQGEGKVRPGLGEHNPWSKHAEIFLLTRHHSNERRDTKLGAEQSAPQTCYDGQENLGQFQLRISNLNHGE